MVNRQAFHGCGTSATPKSEPSVQPLVVAERIPAPPLIDNEKLPPAIVEKPVAREPENKEQTHPTFAEKPVAEEPKNVEKMPTPDDPRNVDGYGKTRWGMTEQQVIDAEADRIEKFDKPILFGPKGKPPTGIATLTIKRFEIDGGDYTAVFLFDPKDHRLACVRIRSLVTNDANTNNSRFASLKRLLTEKYGPSTFSTGGNERSEPSEKSLVLWKLSKTGIELEHTVIAVAGASFLTLVYEPVETRAKASNDL